MFLWIKHKLDGETRHRCNTIKKRLLISCYVPHVSWHFILFVCHRYMKNKSQPAFRGVFERRSIHPVPGSHVGIGSGLQQTPHDLHTFGVAPTQRHCGEQGGDPQALQRRIGIAAEFQELLQGFQIGHTSHLRELKSMGKIHGKVFVQIVDICSKL